jgi:hypothetical protein
VLDGLLKQNMGQAAGAGDDDFCESQEGSDAFNGWRT